MAQEDDKQLPQTQNRLNPSYRQPKFAIKWVNGVPMPYTEWVLPKNQIENTFLAALALPYEGRPDPINPGEMLIEPEFDGLTNLEVMAINAAKKAACGELEAMRFLTDRLLGKPKQAVENTNVNISLAEYLEHIDNLETKAARWDEKIVNVEASPAEASPTWHDEL